MALISSEKGLVPWKHQRLTAIILLFSIVFFITATYIGRTSTTLEMIAWLRHPLIKAIGILSLGALFYHSFLGLKMIIEDYIHHKHLRQAILFLILVLHVFFSVLGTILLISL